tara:strand:+ start:3847 stop:4215 length:369 start_codon:yes stop_codon:yes gene_type:complete
MEALKEEIKKLKEENHGLIGLGRGFCLDCEKAERENEKLKERQMIMTALADSHIQDMNEIHTEYGEKIKKLKEENESLRRVMSSLKERQIYLNCFHEEAGGKIKKLKEEIESLEMWVSVWEK